MLLNRGAEIPDYDGVRTGRYVDVEYATGERELYDLRHDPDEIHNLAGTLPGGRAAPRPPDRASCGAAGDAVAAGSRTDAGRPLDVLIRPDDAVEACCYHAPPQVRRAPIV